MKKQFATSLALTLLMTSTAFAVNPGFSYMGTIYDSSTNLPSTQTNATVRFDVYAPNGTCLLYSETRTSVNLASSGGYISAVIGQGTRTGGVDPGLTLPTIFSNTSSVMTGASACTYTPAANDGRKLQIIVNSEPLLPMMTIDNVPRAMVADVAETANSISSDNIKQIGNGKLLGRSTAGTGTAEQISIGSGLSLTAGVLTASGGGGGISSITFAAPMISTGGANPSVTISQANSTSSGFLTSADWTTFNNKLSSIANSSVTYAKIQDLTGPGLIGRGAAGAGVASEISVGSGLNLSAGGVLTATAGGGGTVTAVTATAPLASTGGVTPVISITQASSVANGFLGMTDWTTFNNKVSSVTGSGIISIFGTAANPSVQISVPTGLIGRYSAGIGGAETISVGSGLSLSGGILTATGGGGGNVNSGGNSLGTDLVIGTNDNKALLLRTNSTTALTISQDGNIGVGSASIQPIAPLDVSGVIFSRGKSGAGNGGAIRFSELPANGTNFVGIRAADNLSSDTTFTWPTNGGSPGQVLGTDGGGILSWITPAGGGISGVTGAGSISVTGGATPSVSISTASSTVTGALSNTDWSVFNSKLGTASVFAGDISGAYNSNFIVAGAVTASKISDGAVSATKMYMSGNQKLFGRGTVGGGMGEEITLGGGLNMTGTTLSTNSIRLGDLTTSNITTLLNHNSYNQAMVWNGMTTGTGFSIGANALTSGTAMNISSPSNAAVSGSSLLNLQYTGTGQLTPLIVQSASDMSPSLVHLTNTNVNGAANLSFYNNSGTFAGELAWGNTGYTGVPMATNALALYTAGSTPLVFGVTNSEVMRIHSNGKIGIGTTSPSDKLTILESGSAPLGITLGIPGVSGSQSSYLNLITQSTGTPAIGSAPSTKGWQFSGKANAAAAPNELLLQFWNGTTWYPAMAVSADGSVTFKSQANGKEFVGAATTLDFNSGNTQVYTGTCAALTLNNVRPGGNYTVVNTSTTSSTCTFTAAGVSTWKYSPANAATTASKETVYKITIANGIGYVDWKSGF